jgi:hypothetical protein
MMAPMATRALAAALFVAALLASPAGAAQEGFVEVASLTGATPSGELLFFPLQESFRECLPLTAPCPRDSSSLMLVPAGDREVLWQPEGADLPLLDLPEPPVRAIGTPPAGATAARYLVPVLDGTSIGIAFAVRGLEDGYLRGNGAGGTAVTPVLAGPLLSGASPSPTVPTRLLDAPVVVAADALTGLAPVLLARRAAPSRVVFGVQPDPEWELNVDYLPVLGDRHVAHVAANEGEVGIAVEPPAGLRIGALKNVAGQAGDEGDDLPVPWPIVAGGAVLMVAAVVVVVAAADPRGALRRRRGGGGPGR